MLLPEPSFRRAVGAQFLTVSGGSLRALPPSEQAAAWLELIRSSGSNKPGQSLQRGGAAPKGIQRRRVVSWSLPTDQLEAASCLSTRS